MSIRIASLFLLLVVLFSDRSLAAPSAPRLNSPGNGTSPGPTLAVLTPIFSWQFTTGAAGYNLRIYDNSGVLVYNNTTLGTGLSFTLPSGVLLGSGSYSWAMRARDSANSWSSESTRYYFKTPGTSTAPPPVPLSSSPGTVTLPGTEISATPTFIWSPSTGASVYGLQILRTDTSAVVYSDATLAASPTQFTLPTPLTGGLTYLWQVRATNGQGSSAWSTARYFSVAAAPPPAPSLISPGSTSGPPSLLTGTSALFSWSGSGIGYELAISRAGDLTAVWGTNQLTSTSVNVPLSLLPFSETLAWRVRGRAGSAAASYGPWSTYRYFQVPASYAAWMTTAGFDPDQAGYRPGDTPGGGPANLLRYAFGAASPTQLPQMPQLVPLSGGGYSFQLPLRSGSGDLSVIVEASENGTGWTPIASGVSTGGNIALPAFWNTRSRIMVRAKVSLLP